jgi:hypothetical protein
MSIVCPATVSNGTAWDAGIEKALAAGKRVLIHSSAQRKPRICGSLGPGLGRANRGCGCGTILCVNIPGLRSPFLAAGLEVPRPCDLRPYACRLQRAAQAADQVRRVLEAPCSANAQCRREAYGAAMHAAGAREGPEAEGGPRACEALNLSRARAQLLQAQEHQGPGGTRECLCTPFARPHTMHSAL